MTFEEIRAKFKDYTAVDDNRQRLIAKLVYEAASIPGVMAEIGVYKGGTSFLIASVDPNKTLYACDSFEGLPQPVAYFDTHKKGDFDDVNYEEVKKVLNLPNVKLIKGFFPDKIVHKEMCDKNYSFVHIDVDLFQSTYDCLNFFYPRMSKGGIIVVDDYGMPTCPGVKIAVENLMLREEDTGFNSCIIRKL